MFARTPRLTLRPGWPEDAAQLTHAIAHEAVAFKLARLPWPYTLAHAQGWLATEHPPGELSLLVYAHDRASGPELVGGVGLHAAKSVGEDVPEIGYWLTPAAWGRGYATEASRALLGIARHALGHRRLVSGHFADNPASGRVLRKLGFTQTGVEQRGCLARGVDVECLTYELDLASPTLAMAV